MTYKQPLTEEQKKTRMKQLIEYGSPKAQINEKGGGVEAAEIAVKTLNPAVVKAISIMIRLVLSGVFYGLSKIVGKTDFGGWIKSQFGKLFGSKKPSDEDIANLYHNLERKHPDIIKLLDQRANKKMIKYNLDQSDIEAFDDKDVDDVYDMIERLQKYHRYKGKK